jgi:acyl-CoA thioester hydrolase
VTVQSTQPVGGAGSDPPSRSNPLPTPREFRVMRRHATRWADNDVYGHVNNVIYYTLFDSTVNGWLIDACGTDIRELPAIGIVAETSCRYLREVSFPDIVHIGLGLEHRGRSSVIYRLAVFREETDGRINENAHAVGRFVHVYVDAASRRPHPIPDVVGDALATLV